MEQTFLLFRHGLATHSLSGYGDKIFSAELLPEAIPAIEKMGEYLKPVTTDYNARSEFVRCKQTADIITSITKKEFVPDKRLNEYDETNPLLKTTYEEFEMNIYSFMEDIQQHAYTNILLCTHGAVVSAIANVILRGKFTEFDLLEYPRTGVLWVVKNGNIEEVNFNIH